MKKTGNILLGVVLGAGLTGAAAAFAVGGPGTAGGPGCWGGAGWHGKWAHHHGERGHWRGFMMQRLSRSLSLDQSQQEKLKAAVTQMAEVRKSMRADRQADQKQVLALLSAPKLDQQKALELVKQRTQQVEQHVQPVISAVAAFTDSLNAQQRQLLAGMLAWRMGRGGPGPF